VVGGSSGIQGLYFYTLSRMALIGHTWFSLGCIMHSSSSWEWSQISASADIVAGVYRVTILFRSKRDTHTTSQPAPFLLFPLSPHRIDKLTAQVLPLLHPYRVCKCEPHQTCSNTCTKRGETKMGGKKERKLTLFKSLVAHRTLEQFRRRQCILLGTSIGTVRGMGSGVGCGSSSGVIRL